MINYELRTDLAKVKFAREGGAVRRVHTQKILGEYDVAQHSFNMLCILRVTFPDAPSNLFWAIVAHDIPERLVGDIPRTTKWAGAIDIAKLDALEDRILMACGFTTQLTRIENDWLVSLDLLELYFWCRDQMSFGNQNVVKIRNRIISWFENNVTTVPSPLMQLFKAADNSAWELSADLGDTE